MFVSRTLTLGLFVFAVALLVSTILEKVRLREEHVRVDAAAIVTPLTVVDVAHGVDANIGLVRLREDERVSAVDDELVHDDAAANELISARSRSAGKYVDLTVTGTRGSRRVLVLMH